MNEFVEPAVDVALASSWQGFLPATMVQIAHASYPLQLLEQLERYCAVLCFAFGHGFSHYCSNLFLEHFLAKPQQCVALFLQRVIDLTNFSPATAFWTWIGFLETAAVQFVTSVFRPLPSFDVSAVSQPLSKGSGSDDLQSRSC